MLMWYNVNKFIDLINANNPRTPIAESNANVTSNLEVKQLAN